MVQHLTPVPHGHLLLSEVPRTWRPGADPGHAEEIMSLGWLCNNFRGQNDPIRIILTPEILSQDGK